jgi:hypothetical protein
MINALYVRGLKTSDKEDSIMLYCHIAPKASLVLSLLILLGVWCIFFGEQANASSEDCTLKNVKGAYGATFTGAITGVGPYAAPLASSVTAREGATLKEPRVLTGISYRWLMRVPPIS